MRKILWGFGLAVTILSGASFSTAAQPLKGKVVDVAVTRKGFEPSSIEVKAGEPLTLNVTRKTDTTCAKKISVAGMDMKKDLPLNEPVLIELGPLTKGKVEFGCGMNRMLSGVILVN